MRSANPAPTRSRPVRMSVRQFLEADLPEGKSYELVDGVLDVSPNPAPPHDLPIQRLLRLLDEYRRTSPQRFEYVTTHANVVIPGRRRVRQPELAVYKKFYRPDGTAPASWADVAPVLLVEVASAGQEDRDYRAKRRDYWRAGAREYWIVDPQRGAVLFLRRGDADWEQNLMLPGDTYTTPLLPGFKLSVRLVLGL